MKPWIRTALAGFLLFALALAVRGLYLEDGVALLYTSDQDGTRMARRYDDTARAILGGEGILFPKVWDPSKTGLASRPPGYGLFLAAVYATFGRSFPLVAAIQDLVTSLGVVLVFLAAKRVFGFAGGVLAGFLVAISPHVAATSNLILADAIASIPLLIAFALVLPVVSGAAEPRSEVPRLVAMGLLFGVAIWLRPNVLLVGPFTSLFLFFLLGRDKRALVLSSLVTAVSLLLVLPITARNWLVFGEFVPVSINGGITLWQGVADAGGREYGARMWDKQVMAEEAERYGRPDYLLWWAEPDGILRDKDRYRRATEVIKARPLWYLGAMVRRMGMMLLFTDGPEGLRPSGAPPRALQADRVPLTPVPGLDAVLDEGRFASRAGAASFLRAPLRLIHAVWPVVPVLAWVGILLSLSRVPRVAVFWLIVPIYYLIFESPFLYEWRVAVPMQYFLMPFAAHALLTLVGRNPFRGDLR